MDEVGPLPFGLSSEELGQVRITYTSHSAKTGVGKSQVVITGAGQVRLLEEAFLDDPNPQTAEGEVPPPVVARLLDLMQEVDFFALEELYRGEGEAPGAVHVIELTLPGRSKKVMVSQPTTVVPFERVAGAIKLSAGLGLPAALQQRFFQRF
ncbi:MAG TPA: hypothetical protein VG148_10445 [Pyrinomonadaceae bacterium]|nr:hypothetical protein [Pyrinomonadaceae bacterium]